MPKLTLKKIEITRSLSEETLAYTANVYVDNRIAGSVSNKGHGGSTNFHSHTNRSNTKNQFKGLAKAYKKRHREMETNERYMDLYDDITDETAIEHAADHIASSKDVHKEILKVRRKHFAYDPNGDTYWEVAKTKMENDKFRLIVLKKCKDAVFAEDINDKKMADYLGMPDYMTEIYF